MVSAGAGAGPAAAGPDELFQQLYRERWWPMLRVAQALVDDRASAEDVVQDAFAALYRRRAALREPDSAAAYLRVSVVNAARSALRRRGTVRRNLHLVHDDRHAEPADHGLLLGEQHSAIRDAFAVLPDRQREVLTLRFVAELSDTEIAAATGMSHGNVRSAASRGLAALRATMGGHR